eukprot:1162154-Pelagomonas_calceolata.AAC.9
MHDKYAKRSQNLEGECMADIFCAFSFDRWPRENCATVFKAKPSNRKILVTPCTSRQTNPSQFYRKNLMLFLPWRTEEHLSAGLQSMNETYENNVHTILANRAKYYKECGVDWDAVKRAIARQDELDIEEGREHIEWALGDEEVNAENPVDVQDAWEEEDVDEGVTVHGNVETIQQMEEGGGRV